MSKNTNVTNHAPYSQIIAIAKYSLNEQETELAEYLTTCSAMFHGFTPKRVRSLAYEMAVKSSIICPQTWHDSKMSGADWFNASQHQQNQSKQLQQP